MDEQTRDGTLQVAVGAAPEVAALPQHLAWLPGGHFAIWRWMGLRSAGFPIERLSELASPRCAAAADQYLAAAGQAERTCAEALGALQQAIDAAEPAARAPLIKALRRLKKGEVPEPSVYAMAHAAQSAAEARAAAAAHFRQEFELATSQLTHALCAAARDDLLREAVIWQNRHALHTGFDMLLRKPEELAARSSKQRQHEALVASYVQRYCAKNDTIGFFGPVGWARVADAGPAAIVQPGASLLASRTVYFEGWCLDILGELLATDQALLPWLAPRRLPLIHIEGTTLHLPLAPPVKLSPAQAAVLRACDGERTAKQIAAELISTPNSGLRSEAEVYDILKRMRSVRRIAWSLELPAEGLYPERSMRQRIGRIGDERLRQAALSALGEMETARDQVAAAAGDPQHLDQALGQLEQRFVQLTGAAATRRAGKTYAGRTLVYEDAQRDVAVTFGPQLLDQLGPALSLLLTSARWFTYETAASYRRAFKQLYRALAQQAGRRTIDFASFWLWATPLVFGETTEIVDSLAGKLAERWGNILDFSEDQRRVAYASADLWPRVREQFDAPHPGWSAARYHSPDVMIAAASVEDIRSGRYQCVVGEIHPGVNTLKTAFFVAQHPAPDDLFQALESDLPAPQVVLVASRESGGPTLRMSTGLRSPRDFRFVFAHDSCGVPQSQALSVGALEIEEVDDTLVARTRDGRLRFEIVELLGELLMLQIVNQFSVTRPSRHTPRISIDRLIVCRESWRFTPEQIPFASQKDEAERFVDARRWMASHGMPRFVFVKTTAEKKPFFVDFDSLISVDLFARAIRRTAQSDAAKGAIGVTEMLPDPSQIWLTDAEGQRYTSELRIVAVDMQ